MQINADRNYMIEKYKTLLKEFGYLPKPNTNPTFMDICHMGGDRFEERCSQILRFYLSPQAPHKLRGLLLNSLCEVLNMKPVFNYQNVKVYTEEITDDDKRIDITIVGNDFVIAVENKIFANLDNPLESYHKYIEKTYSIKSNKTYVVLSVNRITNPEELDKMNKNDFKNITYNDFFQSIKDNMGYHLIECDQTYLTFLLDFMRTIENKKKYINSDMNKFFLEHKTDIDELIEHYNSFKNGIFQLQEEYIYRIRNLIPKKAKLNTQLEIWEKRYLMVTFNKNTTNNIGIECFFDDNIDILNPIGKFHIYITTWNRQNFTPYESEIKKEFENDNIQSEKDRAYMHLSSISGIMNDEKAKEIVKSLLNYYNKLEKIVEGTISQQK